MPRVTITRGFPGLDRVPRDTSPGFYPSEARSVAAALHTLGWAHAYDDVPDERRYVDMDDDAYWLPVLRFDETVSAHEAATTMSKIIKAVAGDRPTIHLEYQRRTGGGTEKLRGTGSTDDLLGLLRTVMAEDG